MANQPADISALEEALSSDCASSIEIVLARAGPSERSALRDFLDPDRDVEGNVRVSAIAAVGRLGVGEAVSDIGQLLEGLDEGGRVVAADALGRLGAVQVLTRLAKDSSPVVRRFAAIGFGRIGTEDARRVVREMQASDPDAVVRETAFRILRDP